MALRVFNSVDMLMLFKLIIRLYDIELYDFGTVLNVGVGIGEGIPPHSQLLNSSTKLLVRQYC